MQVQASAREGLGIAGETFQDQVERAGGNAVGRGTARLALHDGELIGAHAAFALLGSLLLFATAR